MNQSADEAACQEETTFADALHACPDLLTACIPSWGWSYRTDDGTPISGPARTMRLVSKAVGLAALKSIVKFTLDLGEEGLDRSLVPGVATIDRMVHLLQHSKLKILSIDLHIPFPQRSLTVVDEAGEQDSEYFCPPTPPAWTQLERFITGMGAVLGSVHQLLLYTHIFPEHMSPTNDPNFRTLVAASSSLFARLAQACPNVTRLRIVGDIGLISLFAFGTSCPKITRVDIVSGSIPINALHHLHNFFPALLHFQVDKHDVVGGSENKNAAAVEYCDNAAHALSSCSNLQTLVLPLLRIKHAVTWTYLPPSLTNLSIFACEQAPPPGWSLSALKELSFDEDAGPISILGGVRTIAAILSAAPQITELVSCVESTCHAEEVSSIMTLHERTKAGLFTLPLTIKNTEVDVGAFLSSFEPLPAFTELNVWGMLAEDGLRELVRVFPNLVDLGLFQSGHIDDVTSILLGLASLTTLDISNCNTLTDVGVMMCMHLPLLTTLTVRNCPSVSSADVLQAQAREGLTIERNGV